MMEEPPPGGRPTRRLSTPTRHHDHWLVTLGEEFGGEDPAVMLAGLDDAARPLFGLAGEELAAQAHGLAGVLAGHLALQPTASDHRGLLLGDVLRRRRAHPILIAALGCELARRAGLQARVCTTPRGWWTGLSRHHTVTLVGFDSGTPGRTPPSLVRGHCPHEVAYALLRSLHHLGPPGWRPAVRRLIDVLPVHAEPGT
jgi:hypothetical protein